MERFSLTLIAKLPFEAYATGSSFTKLGDCVCKQFKYGSHLPTKAMDQICYGKSTTNCTK